MPELISGLLSGLSGGHNACPMMTCRSFMRLSKGISSPSACGAWSCLLAAFRILVFFPGPCPVSWWLFLPLLRLSPAPLIPLLGCHCHPSSAVYGAVPDPCGLLWLPGRLLLGTPFCLLMGAFAPQTRLSGTLISLPLGLSLLLKSSLWGCSCSLWASLAPWPASPPRYPFLPS